jgi:hypothetical protein
MVAELTSPQLLSPLFGHNTVHIKYAFAGFALNRVTSSELIGGIFQATHRNLENISIYLLLELFT